MAVKGVSDVFLLSRVEDASLTKVTVAVDVDNFNM